MDLAKTNKNLKKSLRQNLQKQKNFNNRYALTEPVQSYDSFTDPHSSYYFSSPTVMSNLKHLKKAIAHQRNSSDKKKLQQVIRQRNELNMKLTSIFKRRSQSSKNQDVSAKQLLRQTLGSLSLFYQSKKQQESLIDFSKNKSAMKISNIDTITSKDRQFIEQSLSKDAFHTKLSLNPEKSRKMKKMTIQQEYSNRLAQTLHNKKRMKWINYLEERKNALLHENRYQTLDQK